MLRSNWGIGAEQDLGETTLEKTKMANISLKKRYGPETDGVPGEHLKFGGETLHTNIHDLCLTKWKDDKLPDNRNKAVIISRLYRKQDELVF